MDVTSLLVNGLIAASSAETRLSTGNQVSFLATNKDAAEAKYAKFRSAVYLHVSREGAFPRKIRLEAITPTAMRTFKDVWLLHSRHVDWDWQEEAAAWKRRCPSRLEMSVWHENHLCGLLIASTSRNKKVLYIEGIEGAPYQHPLKGLVIPVCVEAAEAYAAMLGANEVRVKAPDPAVEHAYCGLGYTMSPASLLKSSSYAYKLMGETT